MNRIKKLNKKTVFLLSIILWGGASIILYWIPYVFNIFAPFSDLETMKYLINNGHINKQELEINVYSPILLCVMNIICVLYLIMMCILSHKKDNLVKYIGLGIVIQTSFNSLTKIWTENFIDNYNNIRIINLKYWLIISIGICIVIASLYIFKNKLAYIILCISTILQVFNMIKLFKSNIGFLTQEPITNPNYLSIIFQCINEVVVYCLYWILIINSAKSKL